MLFVYILSIGRIFILNFCSSWICLCFLFRFCYAKLLLITILKVYFYIIYSTAIIVFLLISFIKWWIQQEFLCILRKNRPKIFVGISTSITNLCFLLLISTIDNSLLFVWIIDIDSSLVSNSIAFQPWLSELTLDYNPQNSSNNRSLMRIAFSQLYISSLEGIL